MWDFCLPCIILGSEFGTTLVCSGSSWELSFHTSDRRHLGGEWHKVVEQILGKEDGKTAK